jgi:hypothetical protein
MLIPNFYRPLLLIFLMISCFSHANAQSILDRNISVNYQKIRLADVLKEISKKEGFYFSYNGNIVAKDSLVTINAVDKRLNEVLNQLFHGNREFAAQSNHLIISTILPHLSLINTDITNDNNTYSISGVVVDERNGNRLMNVSVYEKQQLVSTLTDEHGYFKLRCRADIHGTLNITASKILYKDTSLNFLQFVSITNRSGTAEYAQAANGNKVEGTGIGRLFISARQRVQSLNIPDFFARRPFQFSLVPGLSSHGMFSSQVINKASVNLIGGYTAGVNGMEIGGVFNINKGDSKYLQLAGVFNLVGGNFTGLQLAGVNNRALDTVKGVQIAGFINKAESQVSGVQIASLHNEAHKLRGVQIGLINSADTSQGISIGLLNIIRNGFYKVSLSANNLMNTNLSLTSGTHQFYSTLHIGANISRQNKMYAFGLGIGHDFMLSDKVYLSAIGDYHFAYTGNFDDRWAQGKLLLNVQLSKKMSVFAGATYNRYSYSGSGDGYQSRFRNVQSEGGNGSVPDPRPVKKWLGWEAGIAFNAAFKQKSKINYESETWYLGLAGITGYGLETPFRFTYGGEISLQRDLSGRVAGTFSVGYTKIEMPKDNIFEATSGLYSYQPDGMKMIPVKAGIRSYISKRTFLAGELGWAFVPQGPYIYNEKHYSANEMKSSPFIYAVSGGYSFDNGLEAGLKFEGYTSYSTLKQVVFRLAYRIKLNK